MTIFHPATDQLNETHSLFDSQVTLYFTITRAYLMPFTGSYALVPFCVEQYISYLIFIG